jgi:DNA polymerase III delta prime subunit
MIREHLLWVEKYRPKSIDDCILPENLKTQFQAMVEKNLIPNMTLSGRAGIGKTTVALALCEQLDADWLVINCSENGNIDTIRTDIRQFASTVSITGGRKVVLLDEADGLTNQAQQALRNFMEEFAGNCSFILTCNFINQVIDALQSRCPVIDFKPTKEDRPVMAKAMHKRIEEILKKENVKYDSKILAKLVMNYFPDFRETLGQLQKYSAIGAIDGGILVNLDEVPIKALVEAMKTKNFGEVRKWVANNIDNEPTRIYRQLFDAMYEHFAPSFIPVFVLILGDFLDQASRSLDQEITLLAFLTRVMADDEFKIK